MHTHAHTPTHMVVAEYDLYISFSLAHLCQLRIEMMIREKYYMYEIPTIPSPVKLV